MEPHISGPVPNMLGTGRPATTTGSGGSALCAPPWWQELEAASQSWPEDWIDSTCGSIDDPTFVRPPQGELFGFFVSGLSPAPSSCAMALSLRTRQRGTSKLRTPRRTIAMASISGWLCLTAVGSQAEGSHGHVDPLHSAERRSHADTLG